MCVYVCEYARFIPFRRVYNGARADSVLNLENDLSNVLKGRFFPSGSRKCENYVPRII